MPSSASVFKKYPNLYFIESGTYQGDGVQQAIEAGFQNIISIESNETYFAQVQNRFKSSNVKIIQGKAQHVLWNIIENIRSPITFWLDGHCDDADPIIQELSIIAKHPIKTHTILIDDIRLYRKGVLLDSEHHKPVILPTIQAFLRQININYKYAFDDGYVKDDILVAYP